jgi:hypothetical protein
MAGIRNLRGIQRQLTKDIPDQIREVVQERTRKLASDILVGVVDATPEDTSHAVANWQVGIGDVPQGILEGTDPDGSSAKASGIAAITNAPFGAPINIVNNVEYMKFLLAGSSTQAPADFVNKEVDKAVRRNSK